MTLTKIAAMTALTGIALVLAMPAEAAAKKHKRSSVIHYGHEDRQVVRTRAGTRTRITVRARSYLDPGTETLQYDQHYTDYAFPPGGSLSLSLFPDRTNPNTSYDRMPFNGPFDMPGPKY